MQLPGLTISRVEEFIESAFWCDDETTVGQQLDALRKREIRIVELRSEVVWVGFGELIILVNVKVAVHIVVICLIGNVITTKVGSPLRIMSPALGIINGLAIVPDVGPIQPCALGDIFVDEIPTTANSNPRTTNEQMAK